MANLRETQFVGADTLKIVPWPGRLLMIGDIGCLGGIRISVEKYLRIVTPGASSHDLVAGDHDIEVQTFTYAYHAAIEEYGMILRYDNNHGREGHSDWHHVHRGEWRNRGDDAGRVEWIGEHRWPTLGDVIRELNNWYEAVRDELPNADGYATPLTREPHLFWNPNA